jgi:hypothetical protein
MSEQLHNAPPPGLSPVPEYTKPPVLYYNTQEIVRQLEKKLGAAFIAYWNSPNGSVCQNDVIGLYEILRSFGERDLVYVLVKSDGGDGQASLRMVHLLRQHAKRLVALVPLDAASAATMMVLGSDEILMGPMAFLTAVDTSLRHDLSPINPENRRVSVSQDELSRVIRLWQQESKQDASNPYNAVFNHVHPLVIGAVDRSSSLSIMLCKEILSYHLSDTSEAERIARTLNSDYPSHNYPITIREAARIGLKVAPLKPDINDLLIELNELYSEMGQACVTDIDELNQHNNEILNIIESRDMQVYYQNDKDWFYRKEERRWVSMHDKSGWRKIEMVDGEMRSSIFHIR